PEPPRFDAPINDLARQLQLHAPMLPGIGSNALWVLEKPAGPACGRGAELARGARRSRAERSHAPRRLGSMYSRPHAVLLENIDSDAGNHNAGWLVGGRPPPGRLSAP